MAREDEQVERVVPAAWSVTIDCAGPRALARFWALALGYVEPPPPDDFPTWQAWLTHHEVPEAEWDDSAYLAHPDGSGPSISFLRVPEPKVGKNRVHLDVKVSGGRGLPEPERTARTRAALDRLIAAGATVVSEHRSRGELDHVVVADPEGNEFCLV